jgi:glycine cleavage system transcriptional repressor
MQQLVISAIGPDRPGLVDELTAALERHGANIADSRMINLRGRFAVVMLVESSNGAEQLGEDLSATAEALGMTVTVRASEQEIEPAPRRSVPYRVRTYAMDQIGLVHRITHAMHLLGVNIEELDTKLEHAPHTGAPLFSMDMIIAVPPEVKLKKVREELESLCDELNCDLHIDRV